MKKINHLLGGTCLKDGLLGKKGVLWCKIMHFDIGLWTGKTSDDLPMPIYGA